MRVLLFGGSGFIGQNVAAALENAGHTVGIYANTPLEGCDYEFHYGDLSVDQTLADTVSLYEAVIYLVSSTVPESSMENPSRVYQLEASMLLKCLEACKDAKVARFVYASSGGTVYGESKKKNCESDPTWPICHYGISKAMCEQIINLYNTIYGLEGVVLRISNPYGFGQSTSSPVGAVTVFARKALCGEIIHLYGDGNNVRDFIDVSYVAHAFVAAIDWEYDREILPVFNIGSGLGLSVNEVLSIIRDVTGSDMEVIYHPAKPYDVNYAMIDIKKAQDVLGYIPPRDPLSELKEYVRVLGELRS